MEDSSSPPIPLPPPRRFSSQSKLSATIPPLPPLPPNLNRNPMISKETYATAMGVRLQNPLEPFKPCFLFFYGSLMDPEVLQSVLSLQETPTVTKASIKGFSMKMWGIYPTIIHNGEGSICGTVWKVESESHFLRLQEYETEAYTWCLCDIELEDGEVLRGGRTFCWAGDANSRELEEGSFDFLRYQKYFKASVVRK